MRDAMLLLFLLAGVALVTLAVRTQGRYSREQDERAGRVGGFGRTGRERQGGKGPARLTALDVLLALVAGGALLAVLALSLKLGG